VYENKDHAIFALMVTGNTHNIVAGDQLNLVVNADTFLPFLAAEDFYCQKNQVVHIENISAGRIITRELDTVHYSNSLHCTWIIQVDSFDQDRAIHISVLESHLQWAPVGAICVGYDYVAIHDGVYNIL
jgi:hypothetical protein